MVSLRILVVLTIIGFTIEAHRVYHRIHVPTKIKTIYHTKIIKVPEHHHYIHEKEKYVPLETHHHHHSANHKSGGSDWSKEAEDDDSSSELEYEQADSYQPHDDYAFESIKADHYASASKKNPKVKKHQHQSSRVRKTKHKIIKLPSSPHHHHHPYHY